MYFLSTLHSISIAGLVLDFMQCITLPYFNSNEKFTVGGMQRQLMIGEGGPTPPGKIRSARSESTKQAPSIALKFNLDF